MAAEKAYEKVNYEPVGWQDDGPPGISAKNLGKMDETIKRLCTQLDAAYEDLDKNITSAQKDASDIAENLQGLVEYGDPITD